MALLLFIVSLAIGWGVSPSDIARLRTFRTAVDRWQHDPDFRAVAIEYVTLSNDAMRTHLLGIASRHVIVALRCLPGLPPSLAINPTSRLHYRDFTRGPLTAYLHLCGEQGVADFAGTIQSMAQRRQISDDQIRAFLHSFDMPTPVATDAGAVSSVRAMLSDIGPAPLTVRTTIGPLLMPHIAAVARRLGAPQDPQAMTIAQQGMVLSELDAQVHRDAPQLWRTKQLSDLLAGVWAQGYGLIYADLIDGALRAIRIGRIVSVLITSILIGGWLCRRRHRIRTPAAQPAPCPAPGATAVRCPDRSR